MNHSEFFTYFLKACGLLLLFWGLYKFLLSRETFFAQNRWFLLLGAAVSVLLPLWTIERTEIIRVAVAASEMDTTAFDGSTSGQTPFITAETLLFSIYAGGVIFFTLKLIIQLFSLRRILKKGRVRNLQGMNIIYSELATTPFSFFNQIVLPKNTMNKTEEATILAHEYIHVKQYHSVDVMLMHLLSVFMWINPVAWLYRREVAQNLEYLADRGASLKTNSARAYQYTLLKQHLNTKQLSIINPFINSFIKKRIVMLQKCPSRRSNLWKFGIALPLLITFVLLFNVRTVAQYQFTETVSGPNAGSYTAGTEKQESLDFMLHNKMDDAQLKSIQDAVAGKGGTLKLRKLKRNADGIITNLEVNFSFGNSSASGTYSNPEGIESLYMGVQKGGGIYLSTGKDMHTEEEIIWVTKDGNQADIEKEFIVITEADSLLNKEGEFEYVVKGGDKNAVWITKADSGKAGKFVVIQENEEGGMNEKGELTKTIKVVVKEDDENVFHLKGDSTAHEKIIIKKMDAFEPGDKEHKIHVIGSNGEKPLTIIDGKETEEEILRTMDPGMIDKVEVLKGEMAIKEYGEKGKDGVIKITTKKNGDKSFFPAPPPLTDMKEIDWSQTKVIVDGKEVSEKEFKDLDPNNIGEMEVFKGDKAREKYGKPNAIVITTKQQ